MDMVSCTTSFRVDWYIARAVLSNIQWRRRPVFHVWYIIFSKNERKTYYWRCFIACRVVHIWYSGNTSKLFPFFIQVVFVFLSTSHITLRQRPIIIWILFHENVLKFTLGRDAQSKWLKSFQMKMWWNSHFGVMFKHGDWYVCKWFIGLSENYEKHTIQAILPIGFSLHIKYS